MVASSRFVLIGVLLLVLVAAAPAAAADLHVTPSGTGTSNCTSTQPCSASRADALAAPGDTVQVGPGRYGPLSVTQGGISGAPVTWRSTTHWAAHFPIVRIEASAPFVTFAGFDVGDDGGGTLLGVSGSYSRIIGNHVHNSTAGCVSGGGIVIAGYQHGGYNGVGGEVSGNVVEDIGVGPRNGTCSTFHGIYSAIPRVLISNNVERRALGHGIHLWHAARDNTIVNNTVSDNGESGILVGAGDDGATGVTPIGTGNFVANNIVEGNVEWGITQCCDDSPAWGRNSYVSNLGWRNGYGNYAPELIGNLEPQAVVTGSLYGDPDFLGLTDRPATNSPAIDSGTSNHAPATDLNGTPRPLGGGVDRGAYETG
jgi:parallel beta-helix repeat protein